MKNHKLSFQESKGPIKIAISAAETSGDLIGSKLIKSLKKQKSNVSIEGLAGDKMIAAGCVQRWDQKQINVMGFSEVLKKLPFLLRLRKLIIVYFSNQKPDVFIGVDAPDFNFVIERKLKSQGVKTVHFISPSIWAWRQFRIKKIKQSSDLVLCLFPFEVDFYQAHNQRALFVGHPLAQSLLPRKSHIKTKNILLMPGSRQSEVKRLLPEMLLAAKIMLVQDPMLTFHLALANDELLNWATTQVENIPVEISLGRAHACMLNVDLALVASGTATLELALVGVPMVVVYKLSSVSYFIALILVKSKYISLPNIIANKNLVPELIQNNANGNNIAKHAMVIMSRDNKTLIKEFNAIHQQLNLGSSDESARIIYEFINE
ncbi:lipid-A-disaccharide synthase [Candidatus Ruthia magnifica str. Cm (Calyptogena magnifica)]|uniref:Lipid-A-disaccharide synthase n=1 Tax=Ruthia magnifica subsp. Calyptogena magnifica TaxID=413404 RepID=A1AVE4_RUTMC|nr:lipid-A-disaccharide synthase [Candidatus Ruthturnera calyptogenae]ABL01901.1 lipid-A-disaccharide synthase [Candidatus Ruthia magnifica str. Cm (Calyptogena magnifica)]